MITQLQKQAIFDKLGYIPSVEQMAVHKATERFRLVAGGERSGKSRSAAMEFMGRFWETPLLWLVAADYAQTRAEFDYICLAFEKLGVAIDYTKQVDPGEIIIHGGFRVITKSARDPRKLGMEAPDGILACEASQLDYETYLRLRGRVAEKRGWMLMSGTFESSLGWYPELYQRWSLPNNEDAKSFSLPTWSNLAIFPGGRNDPEIKALEAVSSKEWFLERYGGVPCPPKGRVFDEFSMALHTGISKEFDFDPAAEVHIWIDPGFASAYVVLAIQKRGEHLYVVDEIYERGLITSDIIKICKQRPWYNKIIGGVIDVAATQHQAQIPVAEIWLKESGIPLRSKRVRIKDGIEAVKRFLLINPKTNQPLLHINTKCQGLISEMGGCPNPLDAQAHVYRWRTDKEGNVLGEEPEDKDNHCCKALAYGIIDLCGYTGTTNRMKVRFV